MSRHKWERSAVKERFWRQHVEAWRTSRQTVRAYCRAAGLSEPSFYSWRRELARRDAKPPETNAGNGQTRGTASRRKVHPNPTSWVPLQTPLFSPPAASIEIELTGGTLVRLRGEVNRQALADVLSVLISASSIAAEARSC